MIMSTSNIIYAGGDFNSNIPHGVLKCFDKPSNLSSPNNITIETSNSQDNNYFNYIICFLLILIVIIVTIKLHIIKNMKYN
jgi:hypothetical protein